MDGWLARRDPADERELLKRRAELTALEGALARREQELATMVGELDTFEAGYLAVMAPRYARLDDLLARLAELRASRHPADGRARAEAAAARRQAEESAAGLGAALEVPLPPFRPSDEIKQLFREIARRIHPDLAVDDADRERRERLMAAANVAYRAGDEDRLRAILRDWEEAPEQVEGEDAAAELERTRRQIGKVERRLDEIEEELSRWIDSDVAQLRVEVDAAAAEGRDLLAEMAAELDSRVEEAQTRLDGMLQEEAS